ncbi:toxin ParE1/3/4 [Rhizobium sp. ERR 922]|uniref:type II toxin-antitoxin system RelE/ParE family toxin n=1 Tax=unclassified Rhizobium TaxID=2613769 RepID=UPI0011ABDC50|nr:MULTISPECIES: type II toxin-antitoxin system RelE/ParE family toxin [unclassified Rhizobium]TWB51965.1 toxin ParE1/3/4 [Rhizobium sp. ERR 922]TWB94387.1 toxin ParE1/3/4 [Rhizobium sp. ERR 942]
MNLSKERESCAISDEEIGLLAESNVRHRSNLRLYEEKWSYEQAEDYVFALRDRCHDLVKGIARGRKISGIKPDCLALASGSHFIIYKDVAQMVTIIRILHQRMNIGAHL